MTPQVLHQAIVSAGCPIISVICGDPINRATWLYQADPSATPAQITIANNVVATLDPAVKNTIAVSDFISRWTQTEYSNLMKGRATAIQNNSAAMSMVLQWDVAMARGVVDLNSPAAQNFKANIVAASILTQARADIIFS